MDHCQPLPRFTIAAPQLFDGTSLRGASLVTVSGGLIDSVSYGQAPSPATVSLPADAILAPGFIDIQVNGGGGVLLNEEPTEEGVRRIVEAHRRTGTTGCLPTLISDYTDVIERLAAAAPASVQIPGVLGFHLEGPALNKARKGIHLESAIRAPSPRDLAAIQSIGGCGRSIVTVAPECVPPSLLDTLIEAGFRISAGHSDATARQIGRAADGGLTSWASPSPT